MPKHSDVGDLTPIVKEIEEVLMRRLGLTERPAVGVAFTSPPDWKTAHWATNVSRVGGIKLFSEAAERMLAQTN